MKKKILIIEDNQDLTNIYKIRFEQKDFEVWVEPDGLAAAVHLAEEMPDVILLDIMMPQMNGFEVLEAINLNLSEEKRKVPVIIWSNLTQEKDKQRAFELGAKAYLIKSNFTGDDLVEEVNKILEEEY